MRKYKDPQDHVKMYTNAEVTKQEIKDRAKELDMSHSQYLNYCVKLELNK